MLDRSASGVRCLTFEPRAGHGARRSSWYLVAFAVLDLLDQLSEPRIVSHLVLVRRLLRLLLAFALLFGGSLNFLTSHTTENQITTAAKVAIIATNDFDSTAPDNIVLGYLHPSYRDAFAHGKLAAA